MNDAIELEARLVSLIISLFDELDKGSQLGLDAPVTGISRLFGENGALDSLGLVTLIVAVEQAIETDFEVSIALADEKALSQTKSPYRTVETLAAYAATVIRDARSSA